MDIIKLQAVRESVEAWQMEPFAHAAFDMDRQPNYPIAPSNEVRNLRAAVSPECSYRLVKGALDAAQHEVCLYIYNVSAEHMLQLLRDAKSRGIAIRVMYDVNDTRGGEREKLDNLEVELKEAPSSDGRKVFTVCHQKFAVIDEAILLIGSANWAGTAIPFLPEPGTFRKGNREWLIRIDDVTLAKWFKGLFEIDWSIPVMEGPLGLGEEIEMIPKAVMVPSLLANLPERMFELKELVLAQPVAVTPIVSPVNYFETIIKLIGEAHTSIDIEQQYILAKGPHTEAVLAALEARKDDIQIRAIVSPAFRKVGKLDNWELSVRSLDAYGLKDRLRAMNLNCFTHLHNKGVIIDREKVIISSTNWSENSMARAREAGVLIESPDVAGYYAEVFDFDWSISWEAADVPDNMMRLFMDAAFVPGGFEEIHPADLI